MFVFCSSPSDVVRHQKQRNSHRLHLPQRRLLALSQCFTNGPSALLPNGQTIPGTVVEPNKEVNFIIIYFVFIWSVLLSFNLDLYFLDYWNLVILNYVFFCVLISFWSARKTGFTDKNPKGATSWNTSHTNGTPKGQKVSECEWGGREDQKTWVKAEWNSETKLFPG